MQATKLSPRDILRVAIEANADPRSVRKWLGGGLGRKRMKPTIAQRIEHAMAALALGPR